MNTLIIVGLVLAGILLLCIIFSSFRVVRPIEKGLVERFGKYNRLATSGLNWLVPLGIERLIIVNLTECIANAKSEDVITADNLNVVIDIQVYYKVNADEDSIKHSQYNVNNYEYQIIQLSQSTVRNVIGGMTLKEAITGRVKINDEVMKHLSEKTKNWGIEVVRTEAKEITPPINVQTAMNDVVVSENKKIASVNIATATENQADGIKRAKVKESEGQQLYLTNIAEGEKQAIIKKAEGQQKAFELINQSFTGNAQILRKLEVAENSLKNNVKYIVPQGSSLINVVSDSAGVKIVPVSESKPDAPEKASEPNKKVM